MKKKCIKLVLILSVVSAIAWLAVSLHYRNSLYNTDVSKSYVYNLDSTDAVIQKVSLSDGEMKLPELMPDSFSYFLELEIESSIISKLWMPKITLKSEKEKVEHVFEHRAKGKRYLNITDFKVGKTGIVKAEGSRASILEKEYNLYIFPKYKFKETKLLVLSPHPDDAEIAAYGLYSSIDSSYVITITAGEGGEKTYDELNLNDSVHYRIKGNLRVWNSFTTPLLGGVKANNAYNLGYFDGTLTDMKNNSSKVIPSTTIGNTSVKEFRALNTSTLLSHEHSESSWNSLVHDMEMLLLGVKPDVIVTPHPVIDRHPDHVHTTLAMAQAIKNLNIKEGVMFFYTNHCLHTKSFPYGDKGQPRTFPPNFTNEQLFETVHSFHLTQQKQVEKLLALETMHDLRLDTEWITVAGITDKTLRKWFNFIRGKDNSYFRRATRSNELFYVIKVEDLQKYID